MKSLWNDAEAAAHDGPLGPRVYSSRLLGRERALVLHGGGNTSVKLREADLFGERRDVLYIKGSGWDLERIEAPGFAPLPLDYVRRLASLPALSDPQMVNELATHRLRADAPMPSVETLLHAVLPHAYVDHTHADALLSVSNAPQGVQRVREIYGRRVIVVPYIMPGFELAAHCAREYERLAGEETIGMVLLSHGLLSFGASARESYERMIGLVSEAEDYLASHRIWSAAPQPEAPAAVEREAVAALRRAIGECAGFPMLLKLNDSAKFLAFARRADVAQISQRGPATPDHVIRTRPVPMIGRDVAAYARRYRSYFERHAPGAKERKAPLDPAPRMVLDPQFGFGAAGRGAAEAAVVEELYAHTIDVILGAEALGGWAAVAERDLFEIEYWDLEQAKLRKAGPAPVLAGEVALVTGAASGIGKACVEALLRRGAAVVALDRDPAIETLWQRPEVLGVACDVTDSIAVLACLDRMVRAFGGLDILVLNAGIFPASAALEKVSVDAWQSAMGVNAEAALRLLQACHPLLRLALRGGRVVVIGSRNVAAPGPGAAAYSASKAALTQLARLAALEWAKDGIRVNTVHPDAVYDTALWTEDLLAARARAYGLSVGQYKTRNLLGAEITSRDVAELAAEMCGPLFAKTTGAQLPVDGGHERVI
jgi:rhamnose utilization protein RhaD (predicted bifunctional aldolase and dehydrogenase)/NAD(P)-dependent dehydrogenase (short-subunit alcohol dehydrogenase family)